MKTPTKVKKAWDIVSTVLVVLVVLMAIFLMGARLVGLQVFNVVSNSMAPEIRKGDLIYVKTVDPDAIQAGDVITYVMDKNLTVSTHRVVEVDRENRQFYTKGDANKNVDAPTVLFENLIGVPVFHLPLLGYVSAYIQNPPGMYVAIGAGVVLLAAVFLPDLVKKKEEAPKQEEKTSE